ncbi:ATP-binding cassette domain-containing protein [Metamycoplasma equirhinis]|uniref:ATP-binding cassette domain-containing protein n=1 Tax=Metamycoplasma equirhinis TaxID=92402 RepID=UPI00359433A4
MNKNFEDKKVILSIDNLKKYFVNQGFINKAVDGVSFDVHEGEIVGLIGESGSGKTTVGRTILRLYDDYNGFVRLDDKIISGKRISFGLNKYLRKNVQMIFQDPHASLNGQQNVYTILKEPLKVNHIMKSKIADIFKDWMEVKKAFKYTFQIEAMKLELQNYKEINRLAEPLFTKWVKSFEELKLDPELSKEDNFTLFFGYLEERQHVESAIINNMYSNTAKLIEFYYDKQAKYRNNELTKPELNYEAAKRTLKKQKQLSKISLNKYNALADYKEAIAELKSFYRMLADLRNENNNTFINFINENKKESSLINIARLTAENLDFYIYNLKNELLFKKRAQIFKQIWYQCHHLKFEQIKKLSLSIDEYSKSFYSQFLESITFESIFDEVSAPLTLELQNKQSELKLLEKQVNEDNPKLLSIKKEIAQLSKKIVNLKNKNFSSVIRKKIVNILNNEFKFDFFEYKKLSSQQKSQKNAKLAKLHSKLQNIMGRIASGSQEKPENTAAQLQIHENDLAKATEEYFVARSEMLVSYKAKIEELYSQILKEKAQYKYLVSLQTKCNASYEEFKSLFYKFLENQTAEANAILESKIEQILANAKNKTSEENDKKSKNKLSDLTKKEINSLEDKIDKNNKTLQLNKKMYKSDLTLKEDTIKSFNIEKHYLQKDIKSIYILLGIDHKWVESNLKINDDDTPNDAKHSKWKKTYNFFNSKISFPIAKSLISSLLYKTTIYKSLEDVGLLKQFAYRYPHEFSGGQLQRIVIARALITEPKIIVADEPIASLDISIQAQVVNLLKELCINKNIGLIFIAHDLSMIEYVADKVEIMHLGKIVEKGKTETIYSNPIHPYTINLFKAIPKISNANEKFQNVSFALDYLSEQQYPNIPEIHKVNNEHYIYGTKEQADKWIAEAKQNE